MARVLDTELPLTGAWPSFSCMSCCSFGPEAAEDFATGMETGLGDLAGQRGVVLDYVKQLGARLRF